MRQPDNHGYCLSSSVPRKGQLLLLILYPPKLVFKYDEQLSVLRLLTSNRQLG